jgi:hypothetical protein
VQEQNHGGIRWAIIPVGDLKQTGLDRRHLKSHAAYCTHGNAPMNVRINPPQEWTR